VIISHRHKFIFIHIAKTAGSTAKVYLSRFLGPCDLQVGALNDSWEAGVLPNARAFYDMLSSKPLSMGTARALKAGGSRLVSYIGKVQREKYQKRLGPIPDHCGAAAIRRYDPKAWDTYLKACFVRNPYERMASYYLWRIRKHDNPPSFSTVLSLVENADYTTPFVAEDCQSWSLYTIAGRISVDFIGRHERFIDDMQAFCEKVGIEFDAAALGFAKRHPGYRYRDLYKPGDRESVARSFAPEIEHFGYTF
jgi:hypothetical protein